MENGRVRLFREKPCRILPKEALKYANQGNSNGFDLTEREENGRLFLEFTHSEVPDFSLRINLALTKAVMVYQGKSMTLERIETPDFEGNDWYVLVGFGLALSRYSMLFWVDVTGDGQPELVWIRYEAGTDFCASSCTVYHIGGQGEIIPIVEPWEEMAASITLEPSRYEDGCIRSLVADSDG